MIKYLVGILFFLCTAQVWGQTKSEVIQQRMEFIAEEFETEEISLEDVFENLSYYYDNPLNLNTANQEELEQLLLLSDIQINELLIYIEKVGPLKSIYELLEFQFWTPQTVENILPFVMVGKVDEAKKKASLSEMLKDLNSEVMFRWIRGIEEKAGYADVSDEVKEQSNSYYWGSPDRLYSRFRFRYKTNLSMGITMEKDPGEQFFGKTQPKGFDFYSGHVFYSGKKFVRKVALGDYHFQMGQGLAFWSGYAFGKTADALLIRKNGRGLSPYASVDESRFLRGAGAEFGVKNWSLTVFASQKYVDGNIASIIDSLEGDEARLASSINLTGLHRTTSELARKNSVQETILGSYLKYQTRSLQFGVGAVQQMYDVPLERDLRPYNQFEFRGDRLLNLSADYSYVYKNLNVFGEVARSSSSGGLAMIQGVSLAIDNRASVSILYRNYAKDYHTFYSRGFGERSRTINEEGLFLGTKFNFNKFWNMNVYADIFKFPWLVFRIDKPSMGHEFLAQLSYRPSSKIETYVRVREQSRMQNSRNYEGNIRPIEEVVQRNFRFNFNYKFTSSLQWKTRVELVTVNRPSMPFEKGFVMAQDLVFRPTKFPLDVSVRYALFDTDSFDTRLYLFESNLLNVFSIPAYFNEGSRYYIMLKYEYKKNVELWLRYAAFVYANQTSLGTGPERIDGSTRSEIGVQLRVRF
jgi:HEPN domain-containing protein